MSNKIVLEKKKGWSDKEYYCDITRLLDDNFHHARYKNYIYDSREIYNHKTLVMRVPGRTVGAIYVDDDFKIVNIEIDNVLIGKNNWYKENVNEELKKFVGKKVLFPVE